MSSTNPTKPEDVVLDVIRRCYEQIKWIDTNDEAKTLSPETRHMFRQKYLRILNDAVENMNKLRMGQSKDVDLAVELSKLAEEFDSKQARFELHRMIRRSFKHVRPVHPRGRRKDLER